MTVTLTLPPEVEEAIWEAARRNGQTAEETITQVLRARFRPPTQAQRPYDPEAFVAALDSFAAGDENEQRQTLQTLMRVIDRDRPGQRRIFGEGFNPMPSGDEE